MINLKEQIGRVILLLVIVIGFFPSLIYADERVDFSVKAVLPKNQLDTGKSYFDLRMKPGQIQVIEVILYNNHPKEELLIEATINNATTNQNGLIVYDEEKDIDASLKTPVSEIVKFEEEEITIAAGESKTIKATISMPEEEFEGILLGGLHFQKVLQEEQATEGVSIQNQYAYVIGLQLSENDQLVKPELKFLSVESKLVNYRTAVQARIQNSQPVLMENIKVNAEVYKDKDSEPYKTSASEIKMAPNSTIDYTIDWENERLQAGNYLLKLKMDDGTDQWEWEEPFTIGDEVKAINKEAVEVEAANHQSWYLIGLAGSLLVILLLVLYISRLKKKIN
jgi:hypothetical protein